MKRAFSIMMLVGFVLLAACSSKTARRDTPATPIVGLRNPSVHFVVDNTRKLPSTGTFDWGFTLFRVADQPELDLSTVDQRIHEALLTSLSAKGFVKTNANPDLLVSYAVASNGSIDEKTLNETYEGAVQSPPTVSGNAKQPLRYRPGTLIIDIVETKTKHVLWRGAIKAEIELGITDQEKQARIRAVVTELLDNYPKPK